MSRFLFYISENYAFEILRPLQQEILSRGMQVAWFVEGNHVNEKIFEKTESRLESVKDIIDFAPDAVFVPGNVVPGFIPGLKVQIFHGFEWKKKSHFRMRGMFDLYCTQGPLFTRKFEEIAQQHNHFNVIETGWPKMDALHSSVPYTLDDKEDRPVVLYAPTFSPSLTSADLLFEEIQQLAGRGDWLWLVKFHPKMSKEWQEKYRSIQSDNLKVVETASVAPLLQCADVMVSDTSSIITEFLLLRKPVITFCNSHPEKHLVDITEAKQLDKAIQSALQPSSELKENINQAIAELHPYHDGKSAARVLDATLQEIKVRKETGTHLKPKPLNFLRSFKLRKKLSYWGLS